MFSTIRRWFVTILVIIAAGAVAFVGGFLQEFHARDIDTRARTLGVRLPLQDPRIEVSCYRFALELWDGDTLVKRYEAQLDRWKEEAAAARKAGKTPERQPQAPRGPGHQHEPAALYNAMIAPLTPFPIRGVIWYQGENNANQQRGYIYDRLFRAMVSLVVGRTPPQATSKCSMAAW